MDSQRSKIKAGKEDKGGHIAIAASQVKRKGGHIGKRYEINLGLL